MKPRTIHRLTIGLVAAPVLAWLLLCLGDMIFREAARHEGKAVVSWVESSKKESGVVPNNVSIPAKFSWTIRKGSDGDYQLMCGYHPFARLFLWYSSKTGEWVDDRDN